MCRCRCYCRPPRRVVHRSFNDSAPNAGRDWTPELDDALRLHAAYYRRLNLPVDDVIPYLMKRFGRTRLGIYYRLLKLDLITE